MKLSDVSVKLIIITGAVSIIASVAGCFFLADKLGYLLGVGIGVLFSAVKVVLMERSAINSLDMPKERAGNYMQLQSLSRFGLTALVLVASVFVSTAAFYGVVTSFVSMHLSSYLVRLFIKDDNKSNKIKN